MYKKNKKNYQEKKRIKESLEMSYIATTENVIGNYLPEFFNMNLCENKEERRGTTEIEVATLYEVEEKREIRLVKKEWMKTKKKKGQDIKA